MSSVTITKIPCWRVEAGDDAPQMFTSMAAAVDHIESIINNRIHAAMLAPAMKGRFTATDAFAVTGIVLSMRKDLAPLLAYDFEDDD